MQNIATNINQPNSTEKMWRLTKATKLALTAKLNSIGSSGGTTLMIISNQSNSHFPFFKSLSTPERKSIGRQQNTKAVQQKTLTLNPNIPSSRNSKIHQRTQ